MGLLAAHTAYPIEPLHSPTEHIGYQNIPVRIQSDIVSHDELAVAVSETAKPLKLRPRTIKHHNRRAVRKQVGLRSAVDHEDLPARWVDINAIRTPRTPTSHNRSQNRTK